MEPARECLSRIGRILVYCGFSPQRLLSEFRDICQELQEPARACDPARFTYFADLPHIMSYWYSDPEYLDRSGAPVPLPLSGRGPSLSALIRRVLPDENPASVADALVQFEGVRRHKGLYVPMQRYLAFSETSAGVHGLNTLLGVLGTVEHNVASPRASRILARTAVNPSYPASLSPLFHRWVKKFADKLLKNADNYMELREGRDKSGPRVRLGLSILGFETPLSSGTLPPHQPNQAGRRERGGKKGVPRGNRRPTAKRRPGDA